MQAYVAQRFSVQTQLWPLNNVIGDKGEPVADIQIMFWTHIKSVNKDCVGIMEC